MSIFDPDHRRLVSRVPVLAGLTAALTFVSAALPTLAASDAPGFTFTVVGDYGASRNTTATLQSIADQQPAFHIGLGDFNYGQQMSTDAWCDYLTATMAPAVPIEIVSGNHEDDTGINASADDPPIDAFTSCFSNRVSSTSGTYGREYYFDYPQSQPLARIVLLSAGLSFQGEAMNYAAGDAHYNWVSAVIDDARRRGINWIIVGSHEPCLTMGSADCSASDLMNLLVSKHVDLVLHAHDHTYQRTFPLAFGPGCTSIPDGFNQQCLASPLADASRITRGQGTTFVIVGTGGAGLGAINSESEKSPYFAASMGSNSDPTYGYLSIDVSSLELRGTFIRARGGTFSDTFSIVVNPV